ncbi:hypothetical protein PLICRDRAFT_181052 [Plicaturopsis crispa FD-325 SS-3]|uniref:Uncharacterized protein n=1 Tax=Plicaturopsis crispa FD-325 SS-3 TaxID=944288 RepID=A0A0C9SV39_PLICR|nr:hypothetical protein PLICRDRAFT_181052 [Plicaturopsis crispa FD-325 SS-3]
MLDLILMMHKLTLLLDGDLRNRGSYQAKASAARSGYHHSWYDTEGIDYTVLVTFPSDDEINTEILPAAHEEAQQLLKVLGIVTPSPLSATATASGTNPSH